eukprot:gnl/TRDRNA2_/TRDRNA2_36676_c0_seq1.p1 gnl/TRDRNA2_/TRDRNA2_36676_c0~~gnl/TRDRNA2_/TRDRNA2_36676_c0_seq1.p1  ORF type:complete len:479 (+),score=53.89 gnl/TRDRNA2_/TRDRNA2_36676_c0_seq1:134-1570(+)
MLSVAALHVGCWHLFTLCTFVLRTGALTATNKAGERQLLIGSKSDEVPQRSREHSDALFANQTRDAHAFMEKLSSLSPEQTMGAMDGRGVVFLAAYERNETRDRDRPYYFLDALLAVAALRKAGCKLPVELWLDHASQLFSQKGETAKQLSEALSSIGGEVTLHDLWSVEHGASRTGWQLKTLAVMSSRFQEVLLVDADNYALQDPTTLFSIPEYTEHGAVFWPGRAHEKHLTTNPMWHVIGRTPAPAQPIDSGLLLVDKGRHWKPLALADFFNSRGPEFYYSFLYGDKDLWLFAWLALGSNFTLAPTPDIAGYLLDSDKGTTGAGEAGSFCGFTNLHRHPSRPNTTIFAHRVDYKFSTFHKDERLRWNAVKQWDPHHTRLGSESCMCHSTGNGPHHCFDSDTPISHSPASVATLAELNSLERDLASLRQELAFEDSALRSGWEHRWANHCKQMLAQASQLQIEHDQQRCSGQTTSGI